MRYPKNLSEHGTIGFVAPSFGCATEPYHTAFLNAQKKFREMGHPLDLGPNCYAGEMEPDSGTYKWGVTTSQSYFPKDNTEIFDTDLLIVDWLTQFSEIKDATYVRGFLGRMLFAGDDGTKKMRVLSGGEKVRVLLSRMMIMGSNVLILDEPTDHLDMESITALNNGLIKFPGVILFASRDHQIVQTTANRIMEILPNGTMIDKITTYDEYLESDEMARKRQVYTSEDMPEDN